ncbi:MAG: 30S ribosomal protein S1 [Candidatus Sumerlaeaceae bacterium]|jgi:small subunit ribosomal protein S1
MPLNDEAMPRATPNVAASGEGGGDEEDFEQLLESYLAETPHVEIGKLTQARVISISKEYVLVDVGDKAEGIVPISEFTDYHGQVSVKEGDIVDVVIRGRDPETGQVLVSREQARRQASWQKVAEAQEKNYPVHGFVTKVIQGKGLLVDIGVPAFMPASQIDLRPVENLNSLLGQEIDAYVLSVDKVRGRITISRRKLLEEEAAKKRAEILASLEEGATITGKVKSHTEFGVFVDLGGLDALVPREELAWEKRVDPAETLRLGYNYKFKVIKVDRERERVTLSRRQLKPDPWLKIEDDYPLELVVRGKVTAITPQTAFVVLDSGIEGRIRREHLSWALTVRRPSDLLKVGDEVKAVVIGYDKERRLLDLSLKQVSEDPWKDIEKKYPVGSRVKVKVTDVVAYGAFVQLDETTKGLIHVSDMSYDKNFRDPKKLVKPGEEIEAVVLAIEHERRRINLGIKQLEDDPFAVFVNNHPVGSVVTGPVKSITSFGAFIELAPKIQGLLHVSEWGKERVENLETVLNKGDEVTAKIIKIDPDERKISLSRKRYLQDLERKEIEEYREQGPVDATTKLGDLLKQLGLK